jgi:hypothetical protein
MNVDILASNPDWRWYVLFVSVTLAITVLGWLFFKYGQVRIIQVNICPVSHADQQFRLRGGLNSI